MRGGREGCSDLRMGALAALLLLGRARRGASPPTTSQSTSPMRASRPCAPRRTMSTSSSPRPTCAASPSRRCIPPTWAPSWSTAGRPDFRNCDMSSDPALHVRAAPRDDLRDQRMAARRPHLRDQLAAQQRAGAGRQPGREQSASAAAVDALPGARRGSARALSGRRLLAGAPAAAGALCAGAPTARRSWSARWRRRDVRWSTSARSCSIRRHGAFASIFARGGAATVRLETLDQERIVLDVALEATDFRSAVRGAALDVRHRGQQRRRAHRLAGQGRAGLAARSR